ncbi:MAG: sarcosine oxidase subunit delta [Alphaproteobacteria bacterium]|nr:sarcosine oxidase subunit delta [Alphaproteobacteria bacterium]
MLLIRCPYCGDRDEIEFAYGGQAHLARPAPPAAQSDAEWGAYLFLRDNPKGVFLERWMHAQGCRRWFNVARHTVTHEILAIYPMGTPMPDVALIAHQARGLMGGAR